MEYGFEFASVNDQRLLVYGPYQVGSRKACMKLERLDGTYLPGPEVEHGRSFSSLFRLLLKERVKTGSRAPVIQETLRDANSDSSDDKPLFLTVDRESLAKATYKRRSMTGFDDLTEALMRPCLWACVAFLNWSMGVSAIDKAHQSCGNTVGVLTGCMHGLRVYHTVRVLNLNNFKFAWCHTVRGICVSVGRGRFSEKAPLRSQPGGIP